MRSIRESISMHRRFYCGFSLLARQSGLSTLQLTRYEAGADISDQALHALIPVLRGWERQERPPQSLQEFCKMFGNTMFVARELGCCRQTVIRACRGDRIGAWFAVLLLRRFAGTIGPQGLNVGGWAHQGGYYDPRMTRLQEPIKRVMEELALPPLPTHPADAQAA